MCEFIFINALSTIVVAPAQLLLYSSWTEKLNWIDKTKQTSAEVDNTTTESKKPTNTKAAEDC